MALKTHTRVPDPPAQPRAVQLQLNNSGSWKTLAKFDAGSEEAADKARAIGQLLGELNPGVTLRIATDEALPAVLVRWDSKRGWWAVLADRHRSPIVRRPRIFLTCAVWRATNACRRFSRITTRSRLRPKRGGKRPSWRRNARRSGSDCNGS